MPNLNARARMVDQQLRARGISDQSVLSAMLRVPRDRFVPEPYRNEAFDDHPLPIGEGQTISQPYVVALMLEALELKPADRVLEVGAGSGYITALLAELTEQVFSMERHTVLADRARDLLASLGYANVKVFAGDGTQGLPVFAPFDAILVSAAAPDLPRTLLTQLCEGGRMIVPVGPFEAQQLQLVRLVNGEPVISPRGPVRFVPLIPGAVVQDH
jgi:protein-L-isoaspartate(D-aspartate) O-methyltransferase